jgi:peptidoglycan/xylan/chitin deacetylase (PgdA/CDA1 family)
MSVGGSIGRAVGRTGRRALYGTRGLRTLAARVRPRACVLVYHRIAQSRSDPFGQTVTPERFAHQLDAVRRRHHVMSVNELIGARHTADYPDGTVAVTFDDGYEDTLTAAYPTAAGLGVPIHVFVTAGPVAAEEDLFWWDELDALSSAGRGDYRALHHELRHLPTATRETRLAALRNGRRVHEPEAGRPLTRAELAELASLPLAAIGSHTLTHPTLGALSSAEQLVELSEGRRRLEELTGVRIDVLAYPFGKDADIARETPRLAAQAGYVAAFLSTPRVLVPSSDPFLLPRLSVHDWPAERLLERIVEVLGPVGR